MVESAADGVARPGGFCVVLTDFTPCAGIGGGTSWADAVRSAGRWPGELLCELSPSLPTRF